MTKKINELTTAEAKQKLNNYIVEIERLNYKKSQISDEMKECFQSAKVEGFDVKTMKEIIKLRKKDAKQVEQDEEIRELYKDVCIEL